MVESHDPSPEPSSYSTKVPAPEPKPAPSGDRFPFFLIFALGLMAIGLLVGLAVAWGTKQPEAAPTVAAGSTPPATASNPPASAEDKPAAEAPKPAEAEAVAEVKQIASSARSDVETLAKRVEQLQAELDALKKSAGSPDLKPIEVKIAAVDGRVGEFDKSISELKEQVATLQGDVKKNSEAVAAAATSEKPAAAAEASDESFNQAVGLYKGGKFKDAAAAFQKLTETAPNDARAWYYAALSNGASTNNWKDETLRLVNKGVEREKSGTPPSAKIDSAFADLAPASKTWLDYFRKLAKQ
jgi:TolA-binding protein